jgi:hypothetical protein
MRGRLISYRSWYQEFYLNWLESAQYRRWRRNQQRKCLLALSKKENEDGN